MKQSLEQLESNKYYIPIIEEWNTGIVKFIEELPFSKELITIE